MPSNHPVRWSPHARSRDNAPGAAADPLGQCPRGKVVATQTRNPRPRRRGCDPAPTAPRRSCALPVLHPAPVPGWRGRPRSERASPLASRECGSRVSNGHAADLATKTGERPIAADQTGGVRALRGRKLPMARSLPQPEPGTRCGGRAKKPEAKHRDCAERATQGGAGISQAAASAVGSPPTSPPLQEGQGRRRQTVTGRHFLSGLACW